MTHRTLALFYQIFCFSPLGAGSCSDNTWFPTLVLRLRVKCPGQIACQSATTCGHLNLWSPTFEVSMKVRNSSSSCARKVTLIRAFPNNSSLEICRELWLYHFLVPCFPVQISNFHRLVIVFCNELLVPVHYLAATSLPQTCDNCLTGLSPSFCWFVRSLSALIKFSQVLCGRHVGTSG